MEEITKLASQCRIASPHDNVLNSECAYTFHSPFSTDNGIVVNLNSFMGTVQELSLPYFVNEKTNEEDLSGIFLRIVKKYIERKNPSDEDINENEEPNKENITKLGIGVEGGFQSEEDKYEIISSYSIVVLSKKNNENFSVSGKILAEISYNEETKKNFPLQVSQSADSIINNSGFAIQQDLNTWELESEPVPVSKYCTSIPFVDNGVKVSPNSSDWKCQASGDKDNLWLNLSDGYIGGGRKNWDGSGGSNGALDHFLETGEKYPLVVKLGTITQDSSTADCYSYARDEDGPVKITNLAELLEKRGIKVTGMQKTVKSTAELEVELNATYAFDAITEAGANLIPVAGPGLQGLQNLGNSCYLNSVCQTLFSGSIPELSARYGPQVKEAKEINDHPLYQTVSTKFATTDVLCQTAKITHALTSGIFSTASDSTSESFNPKNRLAPRMFKNAIGKEHVEFRTGQQQDAAHYLQYLLEKLDEAETKSTFFVSNEIDENQNRERFMPSSKLFAFKTISRLVCSADNLVKYKENAPETVLSLNIPMEKVETEAPNQKRLKSMNDDEKKTIEKEDVPSIPFKTCLDHWASPTTISDICWTHLQNGSFSATSQMRFGSFPPYLFVSLQRYKLGADWVPEKLEVNIQVPNEIDLTYLKSCGPLDGETLVPEEEGESTDTEVDAKMDVQAINQSSLDQLTGMGFSSHGCQRALLAVGGSDVESAMNWIFEHNLDPDFNDPIPEQRSSESFGASVNVDENVVQTLVESLGCFTTDQVHAALKECAGDAARAADWLFSNMDNLDDHIANLKSRKAPKNLGSDTTYFAPLEDGEGKYALVGLISHIGKHTGSGHYVCHLKKNDKWVIFNDEKVALSESPPIQHAYIYFFKRKTSTDAF